jgi:tRNA A-37 threonylcarbamoyl transferase component Bud32
MSQTLEECRALEASGQVEAAYRAFIDNDHVDEAARMLAARGRGLDAAELLLSWVARQSRPLSERARVLGLRAAAMFEEQGRGPRALEVLAWLPDVAALDAAAARVADAGHVFEAGCALARHGTPAQAPMMLSKTPRTDERYPTACVEMVRALARGAALTMNIDRWLAEFIRRGPANDAEAEAFYALASVYVAAGFPENADEVLTRLIEQRPGFRDAAALKEKVARRALGSSEALARVVEDDAAFTGPPAFRRPPPEVPAAPLPEGPATAKVPGGAVPSIESSVDAEAITRVKSARPGGPADPAAPAESGAAAAPTSFVPGSLVAQRYKVIDVLGRGGMSTVYRVLDLELNEVVALKLFTQNSNDEAVERFKQEIKLARQLVHENVIRMYDMGTAGGARFLTMEVLDGEDLHSKMVRGLPMRDGCLLLAQACAGLDAAHRLGVVHRDIKPENLFVNNDNVLKVMDFGIAKHTKNTGLTLAGMVVGTPEYMAPEQAHGHMQVTQSADLYSIGVILYALATGQLPFRHAELVPLLLMHVQQTPEPPRRLNPACPAEFEKLILELLAKRAEQRPPTAKAVEERLKKIVERGVLG